MFVIENLIKNFNFYLLPIPKTQCSNYVMMVSGLTTLTSLSNNLGHHINIPVGKIFHGQTLIDNFKIFACL